LNQQGICWRECPAHTGSILDTSLLEVLYDVQGRGIDMMDEQHSVQQWLLQQLAKTIENHLALIG
jgi:hypothetical protein